MNVKKQPLVESKACLNLENYKAYLGANVDGLGNDAGIVKEYTPVPVWAAASRDKRAARQLTALGLLAHVRVVTVGGHLGGGSWVICGELEIH